jgi:beta-aspartyl-peptidase (threonine type)
VIHKKNNGLKADIGAISIDKQGKIGIAFNSERMHRAWIGCDGKTNVFIYRHRKQY